MSDEDLKSGDLRVWYRIRLDWIKEDCWAEICTLPGLILVTRHLYRVVSVDKDLHWASSACVSSFLCRINQTFRIRSRSTEPGVSSSTMGGEDNKSASLGGNLYLFISLISITQLMFMCRAAQWSSVYLYQRNFNKMHETKTSRREIVLI